MARSNETLQEWKQRVGYRSTKEIMIEIDSVKLDIESLKRDISDLNDDLDFAWMDGEVAEEQMMEERGKMRVQLADFREKLYDLQQKLTNRSE